MGYIYNVLLSVFRIVRIVLKYAVWVFQILIQRRVVRPSLVRRRHRRPFLLYVHLPLFEINLLAKMISEVVPLDVITCTYALFASRCGG